MACRWRSTLAADDARHKFSVDLTIAILVASFEAKRLGKETVEVEHLVYAMLVDTEISSDLSGRGVRVGVLRRRIEFILSNSPRLIESGVEPVWSDHLRDILNGARLGSDEEYLTHNSVLLEIVNSGSAELLELLRESDLDAQVFSSARPSLGGPSVAVSLFHSIPGGLSKLISDRSYWVLWVPLAAVIGFLFWKVGVLEFWPSLEQITIFVVSSSLFRGALFILGIALIYTSLFLYENEESEIQNKIEEVWVSLDDARLRSVERRSSLLRSLAALIDERISAVFGVGLLSQKAFLTSIYFLVLGVFYSSVPLCLLAVFAYSDSSFWIVKFFVIVVMWLYVGEKFVGAMRRRFVFGVVESRLLAIMILLAVSVFSFFISRDYPGSRLNSFALIFSVQLLVIFLSFFVDILFIVVSRYLLRRVIVSECLTFVLFLLLTWNSLICSLVLWSSMALEELRRTGEFVRIDLSLQLGFYVFLSSTLAVLFFSSSVFVLSTILLAHRGFWPLVQRPIYLLAKAGVDRRRKSFLGLGVLLILPAIPAAKQIFREFIKFLVP